MLAATAALTVLAAGTASATPTVTGVAPTVTGAAEAPSAPFAPSVVSATPGDLQIDQPKLTVPANSTAMPIRLSCKAKRPCIADIRLDVRTAPGSILRVWVGAGTKGKLYRVDLTKAQREVTDFGRRDNGWARITEHSPTKRSVRKERITVARSSVNSMAYTDRNWTPTRHDTCPASLHRTYSVIGPDGKRYPTWHPATVTDPATGKECTFGHEHGDDPRSSDIYAWAAERLGSADGGGRQQGIPFGYVSEASAEDEHHGGHVMRHEDNVGHKVFVADDVKIIGSSPRRQLTTTVGGKEVPLTCDYLIKAHQGSHSSDATKNNGHELTYAMRCNDGTDVLTSSFALYGNANEYHRGCDPSTVVQTSGSNLPDGIGGRRLIPDATCVEDYVLRDGQRSDIWGLYEVWESENEITTHDGKTLVAHDPWFAVRNPSRYADPASDSGASATLGTRWLTGVAGGTASGFPWSTIGEDDSREQSSPASPFDGAQRDFYLGRTEVANEGGPTVWYADPYGGHAGHSPFPGSVPQYVSSATTTTPEVERRQLGLADDFGPAGSGVHAPN